MLFLVGFVCSCCSVFLVAVGCFYCCTLFSFFAVVVVVAVVVDADASADVVARKCSILSLRLTKWLIEQLKMVLSFFKYINVCLLGSSGSSQIKNGEIKSADQVHIEYESKIPLLEKWMQESEQKVLKNSKLEYTKIGEEQCSYGFFQDIGHKLHNMRKSSFAVPPTKSNKLKRIQIRQHIDLLRTELKCEQFEIQKVRAQIFHSEIQGKLAKEPLSMTKPLEKELKERSKRCQFLRSEICEAELEYSEQHPFRNDLAVDALNHTSLSRSYGGEGGAGRAISLKVDVFE